MGPGEGGLDRQRKFKPPKAAYFFEKPLIFEEDFQGFLRPVRREGRGVSKKTDLALSQKI